jgi:hypothetical protein
MRESHPQGWFFRVQPTTQSTACGKLSEVQLPTSKKPTSPLGNPPTRIFLTIHRVTHTLTHTPTHTQARQEQEAKGKEEEGGKQKAKAKATENKSDGASELFGSGRMRGVTVYGCIGRSSSFV